jgi:SEC-C motif-containing protein
MRSRFTAFAFALEDYLIQTWHPRTRPTRLELDDQIEWTRLDLIEVVRGGLLDPDGTVEFTARYRRAGVRGLLHERSNFTRIQGRWLYVNGDLNPVPGNH